MDKIGVVLGGAPSLPEHLKLIPENAILFGVNYHASLLIDCDYIVFNDPVDYSHLNGKKVSRFRELSDIYYDSPVGQNSAIVAARFALEIGCNPVILAGIELYQGDGYFHDLERTNRGHNLPLNQQLKEWEAVPKKKVKAIDGPLVEVFGKVEEIKPESKYMTIDVHTAKTVHIDSRTSINFVVGIQKMPREKAEAALNAGIAT